MSEISYYVLQHAFPLGSYAFYTEDENLLVIVLKPHVIPERIDETLVFHGIHANLSSPMVYAKKEGTFTCFICGRKIQFKRSLHLKLISHISKEMMTDTISDGTVTLRLARMVESFPFLGLEEVLVKKFEER